MSIITQFNSFLFQSHPFLTVDNQNQFSSYLRPPMATSSTGNFIHPSSLLSSHAVMWNWGSTSKSTPRTLPTYACASTRTKPSIRTSTTGRMSPRRTARPSTGPLSETVATIPKLSRMCSCSLAPSFLAPSSSPSPSRTSATPTSSPLR